MFHGKIFRKNAGNAMFVMFDGEIFRKMRMQLLLIGDSWRGLKQRYFGIEATNMVDWSDETWIIMLLIEMVDGDLVTKKKYWILYDFISNLYNTTTRDLQILKLITCR